jgi:tetratricopeptide (TPR) repeat protein
MYPQDGADSRSIQLADHKNKGRWDEALRLEFQIFEEHRRALGDDNPTTLATGYNLSVSYLQSSSLDDAARWSSWASSTGRRTLGPKHPLVLKADSAMGEILMEKGQYQEAETGCATVLASQQDHLGDDHLDTLETQRRMGLMSYATGRQQDALVRLQKRLTSLQRLLGENHIKVLAAALDVAEVMLPSAAGDQYGLAQITGEVQQASRIMPPLYQQLRAALGPQHPMTIRALRICGTIKILEGQKTEASDTLHRALSNAEECLGPNHPETMSVVAQICVLHTKKSSPFPIYGSSNSSSAEARPWLQRYLNWVETHKGRNHREAQGALQLLAMSHMEAGDMAKAQEYLERLLLTFQGQNSPKAQEVQSMLQICRLSNYSNGGYQQTTGDFASLLFPGSQSLYPRF